MGERCKGEHSERVAFFHKVLQVFQELLMTNVGLRSNAKTKNIFLKLALLMLYQEGQTYGPQAGSGPPMPSMWPRKEFWKN